MLTKVHPQGDTMTAAAYKAKALTRHSNMGILSIVGNGKCTLLTTMLLQILSDIPFTQFSRWKTRRIQELDGV